MDRYRLKLDKKNNRVTLHAKLHRDSRYSMVVVFPTSSEFHRRNNKGQRRINEQHPAMFITSLRCTMYDKHALHPRGGYDYDHR